MNQQIQETLDHLFRRQSGQMVAYLTRFLGTDHLDLAEVVVQEALLKAVQAWPIQGIPENPEAWIMRAAKNSAIDHIRKHRDTSWDEAVIENELRDDSEVNSKTFPEELRDDQLKLVFICCHPALTREAQTALTLKTLCGFGVNEIARAFVAKEETIAQRIVRAKLKIAELKLKFEVPSPGELAERIETVLEVFYLLFNEGYLATSGESLMRRDLCEEAIFRTTVLAEHQIGKRPEVFALLALMHFQISRFNARVDGNGDILLLEEQDRTLWDRNQIQLGLRFLESSAEGEVLSAYHLLAGIASCHALSPAFEKTNWKQILGYYDLLILQDASPIVFLNRAVAVAMTEGWDTGLSELRRIEKNPQLKSYYLLYSTFGEIFRKKGDFQQAVGYYQKALECVGTQPEKRLIQKRINDCRKRIS